jgi:hypothetical protein
MHYKSNAVFLDADLTLGVFIAYEDMAAGKRAKETCDVLGENLGVDWKLETDLASFKSLSVPKLRRIAAVEAAKANILIIACQDGQLPPGVKQWARMMLSQGIGPMALVALLSVGRDNAAKTYLAEVANEGRMQFFSQFESAPPGQWDWNGRTGLDLGQLGKRTYV